MTHRTNRTYGPMALLVPMLLACGSTDSGPGTPSEEPASSDDTRGSESPDSGAAFPTKLLPAELSPDLPLIPPTSDLDIPVFSDIVTVEPGQDVTFCTFTDTILDEARIFGQSFGAQSPQGHHAILQYITEPQEPGTRSCGDGMDGQMLLGGTGGDEVADELYLPENFGVEIPAGAQLVLNHHWINTSTETIEAQAMMLARGLPRNEDTVLAGNMVMLGLGWEIPPQADYSYSTECTFGADVPYVMSLGHMHEWGSNVTVEIESPEGDVETLIDDVWSPDMATGSGAGHVYSLDNPHMIHEGDTVRLTCQWHNSTDEPIAFPREMCIFFGYTVGDSYFCAGGSWFDGDVTSASGGSEVVSHL